jgi:phenylalanyl-tRNA synthetase beta chain
MLVPYSWLRDFAPFDLDPLDLGRALDDLGMVVEHTERVGEGLEAVVVARVLATRPHPDADKVQLVDVDAGDGEALQVVCGAFNFSAGDLVPLAPIGARLPNGMEIARRKVRGEWSNGMLCASDELGLGEDHSGIMVLAVAAEPGARLVHAARAGHHRERDRRRRPHLRRHRGTRPVPAVHGSGHPGRDYRAVA